MKKALYILAAALLLIGCRSTATIGGNRAELPNFGSPRVQQELLNDDMFLIRTYSTDPTYGFTAENPIMVGGGLSEGALNQRRFLNALAGPNGERIYFRRLGSCCPFHSENGISENNIGLLDMYKITYQGLETPIILYINMYDSDVLKVPVGFTLRRLPVFLTELKIES